MICEICGREIETRQKLARHIQYHHKNISNKEYYDKYLKTNTDGICPICGKCTSFISLTRGYHKCCSHECNDKSYFIIPASFIDEEEFKLLYQQYSDRDTIDKLNISIGVLNYLLDKYNIKRHNRDENSRLSSLLRYGIEHQFKDPNVIAKSKQTKFERYGDENYVNIEKAKETNIEKYGVDNVRKAEVVKDKIKQTKLEKYGDSNYNNREQIDQTKFERYGDQNYNNREKARETTFEKYGVEVYGGCEEQIEKAKKTKLEKYGNENYINIEQIIETQISRYGGMGYASEEIKAKADQTMIDKYGAVYPIQIKEFANKIRKTTYEHYGVEYPMQVPEIEQRILEHGRQTLNERYGVNHNSQIPEVRSKASKKYTYNNIQFDSSWEVALWIYANDHNEEIEREPCYFEYFEDGKKHRYFPDFRYKGNLIEIKGDQFFTENTKFQLSSEKLQCIIDNNVIIWRSADIKPFLDYVENKYEKDYLKQFKNK